MTEEHQGEIRNLKEKQDNAVRKMKDDHAQEHSAKLKLKDDEHTVVIHNVKAEHDVALKNVQADHDYKVQIVTQDHSTKVKELETSHARNVDSAKEEGKHETKMQLDMKEKLHLLFIETLKKQNEDALQQLKKEQAKHQDSKAAEMTNIHNTYITNLTTQHNMHLNE
jgi:hypothetical protein